MDRLKKKKHYQKNTNYTCLYTLINNKSIKDKENTEEVKNFDIEFKDVYFKYNKDGDYVLKGISFKALEGEKIGIIGATGSGKSSLISLIPRLYDTTSGSVMIGNKDVRNLKINDLRKIIGVVLQDTTLFSGSIADNLRFGMEITDITDCVKDMDFVVFKSALEMGGSVRALCLKGGADLGRKPLDKLVDFVKGYKAKGLAWMKVTGTDAEHDDTLIIATVGGAAATGTIKVTCYYAM